MCLGTVCAIGLWTFRGAPRAIIDASTPAFRGSRTVPVLAGVLLRASFAAVSTVDAHGSCIFFEGGTYPRVRCLEIDSTEIIAEARTSRIVVETIDLCAALPEAD